MEKVEKTLLIRDIQAFFWALEMKEIPKEELTFVGMEEDGERFPDFEEIQSFICAAQKTELYFERLNRSLREIRSYLSVDFHKSYKTDFSCLKKRVKKQEEILHAALFALGMRDAADMLSRLPAPVFEEMSMEYGETPDPSLVPPVNRLLDLLEQISEKSCRFIRANNVYGSSYRTKRAASRKQPKEMTEESGLAALNSALQKAALVSEKKYDVDIFSDGSAELSEMLGCVLDSMRLVLCLPVLKKEERYVFSDGTRLDGDGMKARFASVFSSRYREIDETVSLDAFLSEKSEQELVLLYEKLLPLDTFHFLGEDQKKFLPSGRSERELDELIGLSAVKESVRKIKAYALANKGSRDLNLHMCFYGNPGTGKTEVARLIAGILYENKILPTKKVVEVDRGGLVGQYVGETPQKTMEAIQEAMGGVLFIDEAYALVQEHEIYGKEAVATLIKAMEDYRGKFCVILAGYRNPMKQMLSSNPGFQSRIPFELDFPNYSRKELARIADLMLARRSYSMSGEAMERLMDVMEVKRKEANFANAREVRNALEQVIMCQNLRAAKPDDHALTLTDVNRYITDSRIKLPMSGGSGFPDRILSGEEELEQLVGLDSVKRMFKKIRAFAKRNAREADFNLHMCFYGNPGTGKTEAARILSRMLYEAGVLPEAKLIETDASGLIGKYVGETGPKTWEKIQDAMGGVLFIDEAYALCQTGGSTGGGGYGEEAIAALLKGMEDYRGQFCVILAGYRDEMKTMLGSNPGFASRIQFTLDFPDYTREELGQIARLFLRKKKYEIEEKAGERLLDVVEYLRNQPNFANARTVRNVLDQVILNQNLRAEDSSEDFTILPEDVETYIQEERVFQDSPQRKRIGF